MQIRIEMKRTKRESKILIDGCEVKHGIMDFDFDLSDGIPVVMLRIWPEGLEITGEDLDLVRRTTYDLLHRKRYRRAFKKNFIYCIKHLFRFIRATMRRTQELWRQQHPDNHKLFKIYK